MSAASDTIFALSSGALPAAIAVVRVSGSQARATTTALAGRVPPPRRASYRALRDPDDSSLLDRALVLWLPGPDNATGEDLVEFHCHGSRAVVAALLECLARRAGHRPALGGEFTRRACLNGRIDLAEAEALGDLLLAETERQRKAALGGGSALTRRIADWSSRLRDVAASIEAALDFADEGEVGSLDAPALDTTLTGIRQEIGEVLRTAPAERLRDGIRVVLCGPPNAGKSSLFNALVGHDAAIVSPRPGTTRDVIEAPVAIAGIPFLLVDTAGVHDADDAVEALGIERARSAAAGADMRLWLGTGGSQGEADVLVDAMCDRPPPRPLADCAAVSVSARTGQGMDALRRLLMRRAEALIPRENTSVASARQRQALASAHDALGLAAADVGAVIIASAINAALVHLGAMSELRDELLDKVFANFCIGK